MGGVCSSQQAPAVCQGGDAGGMEDHGENGWGLRWFAGDEAELITSLRRWEWSDVGDGGISNRAAWELKVEFTGERPGRGGESQELDLFMFYLGCLSGVQMAMSSRHLSIHVMCPRGTWDWSFRLGIIAK